MRRGGGIAEISGRAMLRVGLLLAVLLSASCNSGVPVPHNFPVQLKLPVGSTITNATDRVESGELIHELVFSNHAASAVIRKRIKSSLARQGFSQTGSSEHIAGAWVDAYRMETSDVSILLMPDLGTPSSYQLSAIVIPGDEGASEQ